MVKSRAFRLLREAYQMGESGQGPGAGGRAAPALLTSSFSSLPGEKWGILFAGTSDGGVMQCSRKHSDGCPECLYSLF